MTLQLANVPDGTVSFTRLSGEKNDINTFQNKDRVAPKKGECAIQGGAATIELPAYSATILTIPLK